MIVIFSSNDNGRFWVVLSVLYVNIQQGREFPPNNSRWKKCLSKAPLAVIVRHMIQGSQFISLFQENEQWECYPKMEGQLEDM